MAIVPTSSSGSYRDDEEERDRGARAVFGAIRERETDARVRLPDDVMADPDAAARARKAARFTGTSAIAIERNMAEFDQRQRISSVDSAMRESERMRRWFVKDGAARVSHDDVPALREVADSYDRASSTGLLPWIGDQLSYLFTTRIGVDVGAGQVSVASDAAQRRATGATGGNNDVFARMGTFSADAQTNEGFWDRIGSLLERGNAAVEEGFLNAIAQTTGSPRARRAAQQINQGVVTQQIAGATTWNDVKANPYNPATIGGYVLDAGVESLPYMATAVVPYAGVALVGTSMTGNIAAERAVNDGGTRGDANVWDFINAAPYGFTSAVLERLGIEAIFAGAGRSAARRIAGAAAGEAVTEFAQGNIEYAGETIGTTTEFDWRESLERGFAGALAGGPFGGTLRSGVEIANVAGGRFIQYSQARATEQVLGEIFTGAAKSKLRLRDPELFAEFMATQTAGTAAENLYVNGDTLRSLFQDEAGNPIDPPGEVNWQEMLPDFWDQLAQTDSTGGDVVIPMARAAAYLAGTPEWEIIKGASRVAPGGLSPNEARALEDDWSGMVEELGRRAYDEARADVEAEGPRTRVYNEVLSQARQAGFSLNASRAYADLWSERYQARAERLGGGTNAWQLFQESVAGIRQSLPGTVETYRRGDGIDVLINAMRRSAQDMQPEGEDLISRIMRGGGVVDAGGDIRSMGGGRVRRGGIFGRPLQNLIAEPDASGNFDSNLELDTWALNLWEEGYFGTREERPDINELLDLIGAALRGETIVPQGSNSAAVEANNAIVAAADDLRRILEDAGLDPETASRAEIDAALAAYQASEEGVRGFDQFAGPQSETADLHALQTARDMLAQGRSAELVRRETGWFRGPDGRWRYEISDEDARINEELVPDLGGAEPSWSDSSSSPAPAPSRDPVMLGDLLTHDRLYAAYPDLKMIEVAFLDEGTAQGSIDAGGMRMTLNPRRHSDLEELRVTLLHEVQHLIQRREGFARGGSPRMAEAVREAMDKFASSMHGNAAWTRMRNRGLMDEAEQAKALLGAVYMYETHEQLMRIVASDRPSRQLRHIRGASNWIYSDKIRKHADPEIQQRALDMSRAFYLMPKRHRTRERNEWLRNYAFDLATLIRDAMPDGTFQQFRDDPRQLRSVVKALEREARKLNERLEPVRVAERGAADALRISNVYRYKTDFEIYQGLAGEAEARNTQLRINLTEAERRDTPPDRTADVDLNDVIVVFQDGEISSPFIANVDAGGSSRSLFQSAWHGSPFTFDRFSTDFMGRGEGAQRFGWGLYFTSARAIGEHYREMLSSGSGTFTIADTGDTFDPSELRHLNARVIARRNGMDLAATMRQVRALMDGANDTMREMLEEDLARLAEIEERGGLRPPGEGRLYQVEIPDDDEFMVWEAPLSEQPERVRAAIAEIQDQGAFGDLGDGYVVSVNDTATGEQIYRQLEAEQGDARAASEMLLAAGIAGNKYQAGQLSDRTPGDASNFVVFDAGRVEIRSMFQSAALPETIEIDGVERSTRNSEGQPIAFTEAGVRAFWAWFGDSKLVDDQGRPLVVYHGGSINENRDPDAQFARVPAFFSPDKRFAQSYSPDIGEDARVTSAYLRLENPFRPSVDAGAEWIQGYIDYWRENGGWEDRYSGETMSDDDVRQMIEDVRLYGYDDAGGGRERWDDFLGWASEHHDGFVGYDPTDGAQIAVAFEREQIKSVNNQGTFDGSDPRILFQRGMPTLKAAVRHKGKVYSSVGDHLAAIAQIPDPDERAAAMRDGDNRGFVTERGRFLDRFRAQEYAVANGLISPDAPTWARTSPDLISENLMRYDEQLERGTLSQEGARGRIDFLADNRAMITLFEGRDLSTLLHEGGHLWLEELRADARSGRAAGVTRDWETVKAWMTRETGLEIADGAPIPTEAHELWARAMERYFMEGRAPSAALRSAFASFRAWLVRIYKRVTGLNANLDDEVRKVMDRMIATDEAISFAQREGGDRALFTEAAAAGMTEAEFKAYQDLVAESRTEAYDKLLRKTMERVRIERTREYKDRRAETRIEVEREIRARPEWQAMDLLLGNGGVHTPVSRIGVIERVGRDAIAMLPRGRPGFPAITDQGMDPDLVAERAGFATGHEMLTALMGIGLRRAQLLEAGDKRSVLEEAIDVETDRRMTERYGDILQDGSIEEEALEIIHTNAGSARLAAEVRQLAQRAGETPTPEDAIRAWAERIVGEARIVDQASGAAVDRHRRAMEKAGRAAEQAYLNGDFAEAFRQKQRQQISNALFIASRNARDRVEVIGRKLDRYARSRGYKGMAPEYLDRIHELLEQFDLRRRTEATLREREAFDKWAARQRDMGIDVQVPERLTLAGDKHFTRMTYDEVIALDDAVESLANLGRQKMRLKMDKEERDLEEIVGQAVQNAVGLPSLAFDADRNRSRNLPRELNASLVKMEFIADYLDDRDPNGVFNEMLVKGATRAANRLEELQRDVLDPLAKLYLDMPAKERRRFAERIAVPEFISVDPETAERKPTVFLRSELIAVALNIGNKSNLEKMLQGETSAIAAILGEREAARYAWTEEKVMAVLNRHLSESDWQFVETVWERVNSLWPAIVETERELTGITPEKVEGRPVNTPFGTIEGGYYPLVYDPARSQMAANNADQEAADIFGSIGRFVGTPKGHTISRTSAAMPITFSLERVLFSHVKKVSTRIAYGRYVRDVMKFSGHPKIRKLFEDHLGLEYHAQIKPWLKEQIQDASMDLKHLAAIDRILRQFRVNMTLVGLGFRFTTMFAQIAGWHNAQAEIGTRWLARGVREMARNAGSIRSFVFEKSPELAGRAQAFDRDVRLFYQQAGEGTRLSGEGVFAKAARAADAAGIRKVQGAAFWGIGMIDVYLVAMPTWLGAFHKALEERGMSEAEAIAFADKAVRKSQSASRPKDLAAVQRGPEGIRVLTTFYSYFNVLYNKQFETASLVRRGNEAGRRGDKATKYEHWRQAAMNVWWIMLLAPVTSALLTGDIPEEDDRDLEGWTAWALNRIFFGLWAGVPGIRDVATQAMRKIEGKFVGDIQSPFFTAFDAGGRSVEDLISVLQGDEPSERWIKNAIVAPGYFLGLPTGQLGTSVQYLADVAEGDQRPEDAGDVVKGIVKGPQQDQ